MDFSSILNLLSKISHPLGTFTFGLFIGFFSGLFSRLTYDWYNQPVLRLNPSGFLWSKKDQWMGHPSTKHYLSVTNTGRTAAVQCSAQITLNDIDSSMCATCLKSCVRHGTTNNIIPHITDATLTPIKNQGLCWASGYAGKLTLNPHSPENLEFCQIIEHAPAKHVLIFPTEMQSYNIPRVGLILERFKDLNRPQINASLAVAGENVRAPLKVNLIIKFVDDYKSIKIET